MATAQAAINVTVGNFASSSGGAFSGRTWTPTASGSKIAISDLLAQLQGGTVTITSSNPGLSVAEDGDIIFANQVDLNSLPSGSTRTLVIQAQDDIQINAPITDTNPTTTQSLNLSLNASLVTPDGDITLGGGLTLGAGNLTAIGNNLTKAPAVNITGGGGDMDIAMSGAVTFGSGTINTGGGNLRIAADTTATFSSTVITAGGNLQIDLSESGGLIIGAVNIDASGGTGTGSISINGFASSTTMSAGAQIKSGSRGSIQAFSGLSSSGLLMNAVLDAGSGGVSLRAHGNVEVNGSITSIGPIIIRADVDSNNSGSVLVNAPLTTTAGRIDISGVTVTTTSLGVLDTSAAGPAGTIAISARDGLSIAGNILAGGILQLNPDSNGDGIGAQSITSSLVSQGGNITIQGTGTLSQPIDSNGGNINIPATGSLTISGPITSDGGVITIAGAGPGTITISSTGILDARGGAGQGTINFTNNNGAINTEAGSTIFTGPQGGLNLYSQGVPGNVDLVSTVVIGSQGGTIKADGDLKIGGTITSAGPLLLQSNADGVGTGTLTIDAVVTTTSGPITLGGSDIVINANLVTPDKVIFQHTGVATVNALLDNNVEIRSGTVRLGPGSVRPDRDILLKAPGIMEMTDSTVAITCRNFTQEAGTELVMKLGGTGSGQYNRLIAESAVLGGKLTLKADTGFTLTAGQSFDLFDFGTCTGNYATLNFPSLPGGMAWDSSAIKTTGVVRIIYQPITSNGTPINITVPNGGVLNQPIDSNGGGITIPGTGISILLKGDVISDGGPISVTQTGPGNITVGAGTSIDASGGNGNGSVTLTNQNGNVITESGSTLKSGVNGGVSIRADGVPGDILSGGTIIAGTQGVSLVGDGNVTVTGPITSNGPVFLQADADGSGTGTLTIDAPITSKGNVTLKGAEIVINQPITVEFPAKLILEPSGTATINAPIYGNVEIKSGTVLAGNGTLGNNGTVTLLNPAKLGFINAGDVISPLAFSMEEGAELIIKIAGPNLGQYNRILSSGPMTLAGKLTVVLLNGYVPAAGALFDIFDFTSISGDFTSYSLASLPAGIIWDTRSLKVDGVLKVITTPPADAKTIVVTKNVPASVPLTAGGLNTLGFTLTSNPTQGALSGSHPTLTYTPTAGFVGDDSFNYRVALPANSPAATISLKVLSPLLPLPGGKYVGLIVGADFARSGSFTFSFQPNGAVAGQIIYGMLNHGFSGTFDASGRLAVSLPRSGGQSPLSVVIQRTQFGGDTLYTGHLVDGSMVAGWESISEGLTIDIAGPSIGQYDRVDYAGQASLQGPLVVNLTNNYVPTGGVIFDILDFTSVTGDFASLSLPALPAGLMWDTRLLKVDGSIRVLDIPPADNKLVLTSKNTAAAVNLSAGGMSTIGFTIVSPPTSGTLTGTPPNLTYTPNTGFEGDDSFSYRVTSMPAVVPATVTIRVLPGIPPATVGGTYYTGLISGSSAETSGSWWLDLNGNAVTGVLLYGPNTYRFTGTFVGNVANISIPRPGNLTPLLLTLERTVSGGVTTITGRLQDGGNLSVLINGNSELTVNIWGPTGQNTRYNYNGPAALSGSLKVNLLNGYTPTAGSSFDILDFTSVSGDFGSISLPILGGGLMWDTRFLKTDGTLRVLAIPAADAKNFSTVRNVSLPITLTAGGLSSVDFSLVSSPTNGTLSGTLPNLVYTPAIDFFGIDTFSYRVSDSAANQTAATVSISVLNGIGPGVGSNTYSGLIVGPDFAHSGSFTLTKSGNSVTGRVIYGDQNLAFSGTFDSNGQLTRVLNRTNGLAPVTLVLNCTTLNGIVLISGRIIDGNITAYFEGGGGTPPGSGGSGTGIVTAGRFTMNVFPNPSETGASYPQGFGHLMFTVTQTGIIRVLGRLPDGTYLTNSGRVQKDGTWPIHFRLYSGKGALQALARFVDNDTVRAVTSKWWKPALQNWTPESVPEQYPTVLYPGGFLATPALDGARYIRPVGQARFLQPSSSGSIILTMTGGNLPAQHQAQVIVSNTQSLSYLGTAVVGQRVIVASNNPYVLTAYFNPVIGNILGNFTHPITGKILPIRGVINQRLGVAYGSFSGITETGHWTMEVVNP